MTEWGIAICALACIALLASEYRGLRLGVWIAKPIAAASFVAVGWAQDPFASAYGSWVFAGLCLSWWGDVLLIPAERPKLFLAGIAAFLLAHVAYCAAFFASGVSIPALALAAVPVVLSALFVLRWLKPQLEGFFAVAVPVYVVVIAAMLIASAGAFVEQSRPDMLIAAAAFALSDVSVARSRFVQESFANGAWGLPLYFAAQIGFALSIGG